MSRFLLAVLLACRLGAEDAPPMLTLAGATFTEVTINGHTRIEVVDVGPYATKWLEMGQLVCSIGEATDDEMSLDRFAYLVRREAELVIVEPPATGGTTSARTLSKAAVAAAAAALQAQPQTYQCRLVLETPKLREDQPSQTFTTCYITLTEMEYDPRILGPPSPRPAPQDSPRSPPPEDQLAR